VNSPVGRWTKPQTPTVFEPLAYSQIYSGTQKRFKFLVVVTASSAGMRTFKIEAKYC